MDKGNMSLGYRMIKTAIDKLASNNRTGTIPIGEQLLGKIYLEIIKNEKKIGGWTIIRNMGFILKNVPTAMKKAEYHFGREIKLAREIGAMGIVAQSHLDLGIIYKLRKRDAQAIEHLQKAIPIFEETNAYVYLEQAKKELMSVK